MIPWVFIAVAAGLALWSALAVHDRYAALVAFTALLPAYLIRFSVPLPGTSFALPTTLLELLFMTMFAAWLLTDGRRAESWGALKEWATPISLFVTGATISIFVSPNITGALGLWRAYIIEPVMFFVMFADIIGRKKRGGAVLVALGATVSVVGAIAVFQKFTGFGIPNPIWAAEATRRVTAFYGFPNAIALFAAPIATIMAVWAFELTAKREYARAAAAATSAILATLGIIFAVSEGGAIGLLAGLGAFGLLRRSLRPWALGAIIAACLAVATIAPLRDYASLLVSLRDDSGQVRRIIWSETSNMLADHPIFGAGLSGYPGRITPYHRANWIELFQYPHDIVMNFWSETGLLGLAGFAWIVGKFFLILARIMRKKDAPWLAGGLMAAMTTVLVHGLVDVPYFKNDLAMLFWVLVGLAEALRRSHSPAPGAVTKIKAAFKQASHLME